MTGDQRSLTIPTKAVLSLLPRRVLQKKKKKDRVEICPGSSNHESQSGGTRFVRPPRDNADVTDTDLDVWL